VPRRVRICLAIHSLECGGAERVASTLVNEWARSGYETSVVTLAAAGSGFYGLDPRIDHRGLDAMRSSTNLVSATAANLSRLRRLRRQFKAIRPDVIVSFIDCMNVLVLMATAGLDIPVVVSERTDPRMSPIALPWRALRRLCYRRAAALVVQTPSVATWAHRLVSARRVVAIPNPISHAYFPAARRARVSPRSRRVVALGRLSQEKGFDILIEAFARVSLDHPEWSLVIGGEGPLAGRLREHADRTCCAERIQLAGLVRQPEALLAGSEIFVLSSRYEGFPNALLEGMACGCGVIATDCRSGPAEIINPGVDGVLVAVEHVEALAAALDALMTDEVGRRRLGTAAAAAAERFRPEGIARLWLGLLTAAAERSPLIQRLSNPADQCGAG
jgi:GalNAc-alpha-(1->4)-GalNAc-alpha-(1->3)-diNAcBac-PP-undecaprenol alpha-1,4-N-acetyl-D-galactosaminyltransferase